MNDVPNQSDHQATDRDDPCLSPADASLLDALVEHGWDADSIADPSVRERATALKARLLGPLGLIADRMDVSEDSAPPDDLLVDATLARIGQEDARRRERLQVDAPKRSRAGLGIRIPDFITVAALLLLGIAILFPMANRVRHTADLTACAANFADLFQGFDCYANDHNGYAPTAELFGPLFDQPRAEGLDADDETIEAGASACLHTLESRGYCHGTCTKCGGVNPVSIRIPMHRRHLVLAFQKDTPLAADANPFICKLRKGDRICAESRGCRLMGQPCGADAARESMPTCGQVLAGGFRVVDPDSNSPNHGGLGQNLLGGDGSVRWITTPVLLGQGHAESDNIWLPRGMDGVERLQFSGLREDPFEIVLAH